MIRPATDRLRQNPGRAAFVIVVVAAALVVPGAVLFGSGAASQLTRQWIEEFQPVVYLAPGVGQQASDKLAEQVSGWESVGNVEVRTPDEAWEQARERLGEKELSNVGVESSMFPYSLVVVPATDGSAGVDLIARLEALETRENIETVDVPSGGATRLLGWLRWAKILGTLLLLAGVAFVVQQIADFLGRLRGEERTELVVLERFGAEPGTLRRRTWIRGLVVGIWAGLLAFGTLLALGVAWRGMTDELFGATVIGGYWHWLAVGAPLVIGPAVGTIVGIWVARGGETDDGDQLPGLESLLEHT
ncbi:MAG: cell division protein FtsX [Bradymonadaceae bacterium]